MLIKKDFNIINVKEYGAKGDGINNDSPAINAAIAAAIKNKITVIQIPDGKYMISETIIVPRKTHLKMSIGTIIRPITGNFNLFRLKPEGKISGGEVDMEYMGFDFTAAVFYLHGADVFQMYAQSHIIEDVNVKGSGVLTGTGILVDADENMAYVDNVKFNRLTFTNFEKVVHFKETVTANSDLPMEETAWINGNYFHQLTAQNFVWGFYFEGTSAGNMATNCQFQMEENSEAAIYCEGGYNYFDIFIWDEHKVPEDRTAIRFPKGSSYNRVESAIHHEMTWRWEDFGYMNKLFSNGSYLDEAKSRASRLSIPYFANFNGNQDEHFINGAHRGIAITQISGPSGSGELSNLLHYDTGEGVTWNMATTNINNPIILEVDLSSDPLFMAQFVGALFAWDNFPKFLTITTYNEVSGLWGEDGSALSIKYNKSNNFLVTPPWMSMERLTKFRITFYESFSKQNRVSMTRIIGTSGTEIGNAFVRQYSDSLPMVDVEGNTHNLTLDTNGQWSNANATEPMPPSIPPAPPNTLIIAGNQDDVLANADNKYDINLSGKSPSNGHRSDMFKLPSGSSVRWNNPTAVTPSIIEIDFKDKPMRYLETVGISFSWGEIARNIKVEVMSNYKWDNDLGDFVIAPEIERSYEQVFNTLDNSLDTVHFKARWAEISKLRITFSTSIHANNHIRIVRIFATASETLPSSFMKEYSSTINMIDANGVPSELKLLLDGTWSNQPEVPIVTIPPKLPGSIIIAGEQEDVFVGAHKRYSVGSIGKAESVGNIQNLFSIASEAFCKYKDATTLNPAIIEIDFGTKPIKYMESFGASFGWFEVPKNIKIETIMTTTIIDGDGLDTESVKPSSYQHFLTITDNEKELIQVKLKANSLYKIKFTISESINPNGLIRLTRLFGTASLSLPTAFVNTEADNTIFGNFEFGDTLNGIVMTSPNGSKWKCSISDAGVLSWNIMQ